MTISNSDEVSQLKADIDALKKDKATLLNDLRIANDKHQSAVRWAMNNAKTLKSHLAVCRHDEVKGLEIQLGQRGVSKAVILASGRLLNRLKGKR